jgi:hypothetical protein
MGKPVTAALGGRPEASEPESESVSESALLAAVESLYADELRPYGRILRKRLEENTLVVAGAQLRSMCEACSLLEVVSEGAGEWAALLTDREPAFVDVYSTEDIYPEPLWAAAKTYFDGMRDGEHSPLPGGRYASAQELASRNLSFLAGRSLGQVCQITQLAIQRKLLGYQGGAIVPYESSTAMEKTICAQQQMAASDSKNKLKATATGLPIVDWPQACEHVQKLLEAAAVKGTMRVPLSNVKRLFRTLFNLELSETALGYTKLSELLQDKQFHNVCSVQLEERGYAVLPPAPAAAPADGSAGEEPSATEKGTDSVWAGPSVRRTFIHFEQPKASSGCRRRSASLPLLERAASEASTCSLWGCEGSGDEEGLTTDESRTPSEGGEVDEASPSQPPPLRGFCLDEPLDFDEDVFNALSHAPIPATPSPWYSSTMCYQEPAKRTIFCPDEPLEIEDSNDTLADFPMPMTPSPWPLPRCVNHEHSRIVHIADLL